MSITTERPIADDRLAHRPVRTAARGRTDAQRRAVMQRRRSLSGSTVHRHAPHSSSGVDRAHRTQRITVLGAVAGVVGTALVLLALVAIANLRAGSLEAAQPAVLSAEISASSDGATSPIATSGSVISGSVASGSVASSVNSQLFISPNH